jgi:hypothetical protein
MLEREATECSHAESRVDARDASHSILWRRLDLPGHDAAALFFVDGVWRLSGSAVFANDQEPCRLDYLALCDSKWQTLSTTVTGWIGRRPVDIEIVVDSQHQWRLKGRKHPQVAGCIDVDLNFSPATNLLPIRRLGLSEGQEAPVRAAWLRFPSLELEPLEQVYRRTGPRTYVYQSDGGRFVREIEVDEFGFVVRYPGLWEMEARASMPNA